MPLAASAKPIVGSVKPITAIAGAPVTLQASVSSAASIERCSLWVDLADVGPMTVANGMASSLYTFPSGGSRIAFVFCKDQKGEMSSGATTAIEVSGKAVTSAPLGAAPAAPKPTEKPIPTPAPTPVPPPAPKEIPKIEPIKETIKEIPVEQAPPVEQPQAAPAALPSRIGQLIKAICPQQAGADHSCHSVYYVGKDGKRHSFPNKGVFFSWYKNFNSVQEVSLGELQGYELGANVTYRAGVKMVKFTTDPKVYAIGHGGILRWIKTEELARAFYGSDWNKNIDDIPDTFLANYEIGTEIGSTTEYNPEAEFKNSTE